MIDELQGRDVVGARRGEPTTSLLRSPVAPAGDAASVADSSADSSKSIDEQVRSAIATKRLIQLGYAGKLRVVEPHDYGIHQRTPRLLGYQLREPSGTRRKGATGWRLFDVAKIDSCSVLDETFPGSRGASHQRHNTWDVLYARVG